MRHAFRTVLALLIASILGPAAGADVYLVAPVSDLELLDGELPSQEADGVIRGRHWQRQQFLQPYGILEGDGEIYFQPASWNFDWRQQQVAIRIPERGPRNGVIVLPKSDYSGMTVLKFKIPASKFNDDDRQDFYSTKLQHYTMLRERGLPGAAWFRHQANGAQQELGEGNRSDRRDLPVFGGARYSLENTYSLISGGRAISENLQLDRLLPEASTAAADVPLDSIKGVTVRSFDWKPLIQEAAPERDPLARLIPDDQYALFFPSFQAMADVADHAGEQGADALHAAEPRAEQALVRERYEKQLGLGLTKVARLLGPAIVESVALTGGDPYLRTGADLAVLFEAEDPHALRAAIDAQIAASVHAAGDAETVTGDVRGTPYKAYRSADRSICSYSATVGQAVVVTNSPVQLERIVRASAGDLPAIDGLDEYTFFRERYQRGSDDESGLLVLSDNAIRKWCGPRWRIAASRRIRAAALMAEMHASHLDELAAGKVAKGPLHTDHSLPDAGDFTFGPRGVQSSAYGTLEFLTPIIELDFDRVTKQEAQLYERWREGYERNWTNFFDPIAVRLYASTEKLAADLTVMPLIEFSDYRELVAVSRGAAIGEHSGDPHAESIVHAVLAVNTDAAAVRQGANMAAAMINVDPLGWIGESVAIYLDDDPLWEDLAKIKDEKELREFSQQNAHRTPIGASIEIKSGVKLVAFLASVRTFIEQAAPGMTAWETLKHRDQSYVKVGPSAAARSGNDWDNLALYYSPSGDVLLVSLSEGVLRRAIDRNLDRREQKAAGKPVPRTGPPWLGENLCVTANRKLVDLLATALGRVYYEQMQRLCWGNLPILNEWHSRYPDEDPVELHQRLWHLKLACPGGGEYRWNEDWHTMESTLYGHPGEPKTGAALPAFLRSLSDANFGQTFEPNGLRARIELRRIPSDE